MFQPETLSRTEARSASAKISKRLKIRELFRPFFGTPPAAIKSSSREQIERVMNPVLELEEIWADDEQSRNARTIRQTVPTNCSSTA